MKSRAEAFYQYEFCKNADSTEDSTGDYGAKERDAAAESSVEAHLGGREDVDEHGKSSESAIRGGRDVRQQQQQQGSWLTGLWSKLFGPGKDVAEVITDNNFIMRLAEKPVVITCDLFE